LNMTSNRQTAANRRNAEKSTGPRSSKGKKRSSQNAHRHGLTKPITSAAFQQEVESLACQIAGTSNDAASLALSRKAAEAHLELMRVWRTKKALIERAMVFGGLDSPQYFRSDHAEMRWMLDWLDWHEGKRRKVPESPPVLNPSAPLPAEESAREAEAIRRIVSELSRLGRYERRAAGRRDSAIRALIKAATVKRKTKDPRGS
jgi:hypothetical protein